MLKKILVGVLVLVVLAGGFLFFTQKRSASSQVSQTEVKAMTAEPSGIVIKVSADGQIQPEEKVEIKAEISGLAESIIVDEGEQIDTDQSVIKLSNETLNDNLDSAKLRLAELNQNYQEILTQYKYQDNQQNLKLNDAKNNLEIAQLSLDKEKITLNNQKDKLETQLEKADNRVERTKETYQEKSYLYESDAISLSELEQAEENYTEAQKEYKNIKEELSILIEKTIPVSIQLAEMKVKNAENQLSLLKSSFQKDKITQEKIDLLKLKVDNAQNNIRGLEREQNKLKVESPQNGTILELAVNRGDKVMEGQTVGTIASIDELIVEAWVDELHINDISINQEVIILSDAISKDITGQVVSIAPAAKKQGNVNRFKVKIKFDNGEKLLRPGMFVNTEIITEAKDSVITVPPLSVMGNKDKYVYIIKDGQAEKREIKVGLKNLSKVEVVGVEAGEKVIVGPYPVLKNLKPGTPVTDKKKQ